MGETRRAFVELADSGHEWVDLHEEVARRVMINHRQQQRERRSRAANALADMFLARGNGASGRIAFRYRHQTQLAASELEAAGEIEHRFLDEEGRLRKKPEGRLDYRDKRYRLVPEAAKAEGAETSPLDRFENLARRIEALSDGAPIQRFGGNEEAIVVAREVDASRLGLNLAVPDSPVKFYATVGYLPGSGSEDAPSDRDPSVISVASYTPGHEPTYGNVSSDGVSGDTPDSTVLGSLSALEGAVSIMELSQQAEAAEGDMATAYARFFSPPTVGTA